MIETGEIYHISQESIPTGHELWSNRPGIIISSKADLQNEGTVKIIYISSKDKKRPNSVRISDKAFFNKQRGKQYKDHVALCSQIHTVDKSRLQSCYGKISDQELNKIKTEVIQTIF